MIQFGAAVRRRKKDIATVCLGHVTAIGVIFHPVRINSADQHRKVAKVPGNTRRVNSEVFSVRPVGIIPGCRSFSLKRAGGEILGRTHCSFGIFIIPESDAPEILGVIGQRRTRINDVRAAAAFSGVGHART